MPSPKPPTPTKQKTPARSKRGSAPKKWRRADAEKLSEHIAYTHDLVRRQLRRALAVVFSGASHHRPTLSPAGDNYALIHREHEEIEKTFRAEMTKAFAPRRGATSKDEWWIEIEMATSINDGLGPRKASRIVEAKLNAAGKSGTAFTASAIEARYRRRESNEVG